MTFPPTDRGSSRNLKWEREGNNNRKIIIIKKKIISGKGKRETVRLAGKI